MVCSWVWGDFKIMLSSVDSMSVHVCGGGGSGNVFKLCYLQKIAHGVWCVEVVSN